jgi:hypothetical protein
LLASVSTVLLRRETPQLQHNTVTAQKIYFAFESSAFRSPSDGWIQEEEVGGWGGSAGGLGGEGTVRVTAAPPSQRRLEVRDSELESVVFKFSLFRVMDIKSSERRISEKSVVFMTRKSVVFKFSLLGSNSTPGDSDSDPVDGSAAVSMPRSKAPAEVAGVHGFKLKFRARPSSEPVRDPRRLARPACTASSSSFSRAPSRSWLPH